MTEPTTPAPQVKVSRWARLWAVARRLYANRKAEAAIVLAVVSLVKQAFGH